MHSTFDETASNFERYRSLPTEVPGAVGRRYGTRCNSLRQRESSRLAQGRDGSARLSLQRGISMSVWTHRSPCCRSFPRTARIACRCQADGRQLPFCDDTFDVVLLMQVLSGVGEWQGILSETRRVLLPGRSVAVGQTKSPESGIDAQLKHRLAAILEEMGVAWHRPQESRQQALAWLESSTVHHVHAQAASLWNVIVTPQEFLVRRRTGARFAALFAPYCARRRPSSN